MFRVAITGCYPDRPPVRGGGGPYSSASRTLRAREERLQQRAGVLVERFNTTLNQGIIALRGPSQINPAAYDCWRGPDEPRVFGRSDVRHEHSKDDSTGRGVQGVEIAITASHIDGKRSRNRGGCERGSRSDAMAATTGCGNSKSEQLLPQHRPCRLVEGIKVSRIRADVNNALKDSWTGEEALSWLVWHCWSWIDKAPVFHQGGSVSWRDRCCQRVVR